MLKRVAVLGLLVLVTLGNLLRPVEAAGLGGLAAFFLLGHLSSADAGWGRGGGFHRAPSYPRYYGGYYRDVGPYRDGGFYRAPYYAGYDAAPYGYSGCPPYGYYGGYDGYGYDGYGW
jgi:hypothetical protein